MRRIETALGATAHSLAFLLTMVFLLFSGPGPAEAACPPGTVAGPGGNCMRFTPPPVACPGGLVRNSAGQCVPMNVGPSGNVVRCPPTQVLLSSGICGCPPGRILTSAGTCVVPF